MSGWVRWAAPPAIVVSIAAPAHAVRYLSVEQAQKIAFPDTERAVPRDMPFTIDLDGQTQTVKVRAQETVRLGTCE